MSFDDQIRSATDGAAASLRQHLEAELHNFAQQVLRAAAEEQQRAVAAASQKVAAEIRKEAEGQLAQIRAAAQKHGEELKRAAELQVGALRTGLDELRAQAHQQIDAARRHAQTEVENAKAEVGRFTTEIERANLEVERARAETEALKAEATNARNENEKLKAHATAVRDEFERLKADAVRVIDENEKLKADGASAREQNEKLETEAANARAESEMLKAAVVSARDENERLKAHAATARDESERLKADAAQAADENERLKGDAANARDEVAKWRRAVEHAQADTETARADAETARADAERVRASAERDVASMRSEIEVARQAAVSEAEQARKAAAAEAEQARNEAAVEAERAFATRLAVADLANQRKLAEAVERGEIRTRQELDRAARLGDAIHAIDEAGGLSEVLERLVQCAAREVDRAAMLIVKRNRLAGWRLAGFPPDAPPAKAIDLGLDQAGLAGAVVESGVACSRPADATDGPSLPPFAGDRGERHAMALPVRVGGDVVAVLYVDAPGNGHILSSEARWPAILEVLTRHASRMLEAMTVQQAAGLPLQRPVARAFTAPPGPSADAGSGEQEVVGSSP